MFQLLSIPSIAHLERLAIEIFIVLEGRRVPLRQALFQQRIRVLRCSAALSDNGRWGCGPSLVVVVDDPTAVETRCYVRLSSIDVLSACSSITSGWLWWRPPRKGIYASFTAARFCGLLVVRNVDDGINKVDDMTSWDWDCLRNSRANTSDELGDSLADGCSSRASKRSVLFSGYFQGQWASASE
jgi:hypothetical protein